MSHTWSRMLGGLMVLLAVGTAQARYKGYAEINTQLFSRILTPSSFGFVSLFDVSLSSDTPVTGISTGTGTSTSSGGTGELMKPLLGIHAPNGNNEFKNGTPNEMNALVWHLAMELLATDVAQRCERKTTLVYKETFAAVLDGLCQKKPGEPFDEILLSKFWSLLVAFDAPPDEYRHWRDFLNAEYATRAPKDFLYAMTFAAGFSADFLISKRN